jgi:uncharacterized membrane protein
MNAASSEALWARLRGASLVDGEIPQAAARSPWFVRVMLGVAGWIGALFLLAAMAFAIFEALDKAAFAFGLGVVLCAGAVALFRANPEGDFTGQFGLAVSMAGQALMVYALSRWFGYSFRGAALAIALQQALLFVLAPNFVHRVWASWTGAYAAAFAMGQAGLGAFAPAAVTLAFLWVWLAEFDHPRRGALLRAGGYGLTLAAVQTAVLQGALWTAWLGGLGSRRMLVDGSLFSLGGLAAGLVLVWAVYRLLRREGVELTAPHARFALAGAGVIALVSLKAPGVGPAVAILVTGYANGNRVLAGLGVLALLGYLSHYYYALDATLLQKSALMAAAGIALLLARLALRRWWPEKEARHA